MSEPHVRVAAAMIAGGSMSKDKLVECLKSLVPYVDNVFINWNGEGEFPLSVNEADDFKVAWRKYEWEDDFALARNQSFEMIDKKAYDWTMWIDADDRLVHGDKIQEMLSGLDPNVGGVFVRYQYQTADDGVTSMIDQWRERFMRLDRPWMWHFPVHEVCHAPPGTAYARRDDVFIQHFREASLDDMATRRRNRRILVRARQENPEEPRHVYYLANEIFAEIHRRNTPDAEHPDAPEGMREMDDRELAETAIKLYAEFIKSTMFNDDAYIANCHMAECYRTLGRLDTALDQDVQGIKLHPTWPKAYVGVCKTLMEMKDWVRMEFWANACIKLTSPPGTTQVVEPLDNVFHPYLLRGVAREEQGNFEGALEDYRHALTIQPDHVQVNERIPMIEGVLAQKEAASPGESVVIQQRRFNFGTMPEKSIAFITRPHFEPWHPLIEGAGGAGGAETCIMRIAPYFLANGWRVVVFGTPGIFAGTDEMGCEWYPAGDWTPGERFKIVVASRAPEIFDAQIDSDVNLLWMHDVNVGPDFMQGQWGDRLSKINGIISLSAWHYNHLNRLYGVPKEKLRIVPNGIDPRLFDPDPPGPERNPNRFIYSSSPDRGLDTVLALWPEIKKINPDAELHVFYGWAGIDRLIAHQGPDSNHSRFLGPFKYGIMNQIEQLGGESGGVYWHDRVPQMALAIEQMKSSYWIYPTNFCETYCITAVEMQAAGVLPITVSLAGLTENVGNPQLMIPPGHVGNVTFRKSYIDHLKKVVNAPESKKAAWRLSGYKTAMDRTWDHSFEKWAEMLTNMGVV